MEYIKAVDGQPPIYPYTIDNVKRDNPSVSFPRTITNAMLSKYDVFPVYDEVTPDFDPKTHKAFLGEPEYLDGQWTRSWTVEEMSVQEKEDWLAPFIQAVKDESNRRIYARVPATKQSNYLARTSELKLIVDGIKNPSYDPEDPLTTEWLEGWEPRSWTPQELGQFNFFNGEWQWVLTVRAASNAIEQQILGMTGNEILEFDISASAEWPE